MRNYTTKNDLSFDNQSVPLYKQIVDDMLKRISSGILKPDEMLPPTREWALELDVSRKTIVRATELLLIKGKLYSKERQGLFVSAPKVSTSAATKPVTMPNATPQVNVAEDAVKGNPAGNNVRIVVNDGFPDTRMQPFREFSRAYRKIFNRMAQWRRLGYNDAAGYRKFRNALCDLLWHNRGINLQEHELALVRGSQMALFLIANSVLAAHDVVAIESPGYGKACEVFRRAGLDVVGIPVDRYGIDTERLEQLCIERSITAVYVTPRYQYPTTATMSMARRQKLRDMSLKYGFIVIEDDFGAEYTFTDHKQMALSSMLHKTHYIYIGTFSKIFAPGIRLGYVCASADIIRQIVDYRSIVDIHGDNTLERAMLELFENGDMNRHIRSAVRVYKERLAFISSEIKRILGKSVEYRKPGGGLAVWIGLGTTKNADTFRAMMLAKGIDIPVFTLDDGSIGVRIGYASMDNSEVTEVLSAIRSVLEL